MSSDETEASIIEAGEMQSTEEKMRRALGLDGGASRTGADKSGQRLSDRTLQLSSGGSLSSGHVPSGGPTERRKHRFVQDGEIQYTVERRRSWTPGTAGGGAGPGQAGVTVRTNANLSGTETTSINPVETLQASLRAEQATRERMERLLREAQTKIHDLQTNIGHAALARTEAQQALTAALARIEALEAAAADHQARLAAAMSAREAAIEAQVALSEELAAEREARLVAEKAVQDAVATRLNLDVVRDAVVAPRKATTTTKARKPKEPQPVKWWIKSTSTKSKAASKKI